MLRTGDTRVVRADSASNIFGFVRFAQGEQVLVLINNSPTAQNLDLAEIRWPLAVPNQVQDLLSPFGVRLLA